MTHQFITSCYTDGACAGNPGPGGWGVVICYADGSIHELGGKEPQTTNNRMEMQAAIIALEFLVKAGQQKSVTLYTDSEYVQKGITQWIHGWKRKGWETSSGKPVLNQDLWEYLDQLNSKHIQWEYVRGHSGDTYNERCDQIARAFSLGRTPLLRQKQQSQSEKPIQTKPLVKVGQKSGPAPLPLDPLLSNPPLEYSQATDRMGQETIQLTNSHSQGSVLEVESAMTNQNTETSENLPREVRVEQLRHLVETLHTADEIASKRYLVTSSELADLMDINASAVTSRGDNWVWRNWVVSRVRREGNQILWQLERVD